MEIGMLWYDDSPTGLKDRVERAADYYIEKHGRQPNLCFVHPDMLKTEEGKAKGVVIRKGKGVMPGHFWIGVDESQVKKNGYGKTNSEAKAKPASATNAKPKSKPKAKSGSAKAATKKAAPAKPKAKSASAKPKSASAKPKKRKQALLKKKSGSRVKTTSKTKSKAKS